MDGGSIFVSLEFLQLGYAASMGAGLLKRVVKKVTVSFKASTDSITFTPRQIYVHIVIFDALKGVKTS